MVVIWLSFMMGVWSVVLWLKMPKIKAESVSGQLGCQGLYMAV